MRESQMAGELTMSWVPVVDARGRTHMEARWTVAPEPVAPHHPSHAPSTHAA